MKRERHRLPKVWKLAPCAALLAALAAFAAAAPAIADQPQSGKPPFRVLFSNDTTNITSCISPFRPDRKAGFNDDMLRATIDEAVGVDAHLLQPGMGWIPWWKSSVYPADEHYRYYERQYGLKPNEYGRYMIAGGDLVKTFVEHCRRRGVAPFVSLRLNDGHGLEFVGQKHPMAAHTVSRFYEQHYLQWRIGPDKNNWDQRVLDWSVGEVRGHKLAMIEELAAYDLDGLELDFMRHANYFPDTVDTARRREIMVGFVGQVRAALDRRGKGRRRWLCVRVPAWRAWQEKLGIDLPSLARAGADMANLSASYFTVQQTDLAELRRLVPSMALYLEMTHTTLIGRSRGNYDSFKFLRTTPAQLATTAEVAWRQGADGVSLFNFVYYREHGGKDRGTFAEPPFEVLPRLADRAWLAEQPRWYFATQATRKMPGAAAGLPAHIVAGAAADFRWQLSATAAPGDGVLRFFARQPQTGRQWEVSLNGQRLPARDFVAKPLPHPYDVDLAEPELYACFDCPRAAVRDGENVLRLKLAAGPAATIDYVDLVVPAAAP